MVGPRAHLQDRAGWPGFELAVLKNRKVDATEDQPCEVDADSLLDRHGIDRIGQVPGLLPLDHVHIAGGKEVAAIGAVFSEGPLTAGAPQIWVADIVIVRNRHGWTALPCRTR